MGPRGQCGWLDGMAGAGEGSAVRPATPQSLLIHDSDLAYLSP